MNNIHAWHPAVDDRHVPTRRRVLVALKIMGEAAVQDLSERLGLTPMGVRRHLTALEEEDMVNHRIIRHGQGRPKYLYYLTAKAHTSFEQRYAALSVELLGYISEEFGEQAVYHLFERRAQRRIAETLPQLEGLPIKERVARLVEILDREGYLAEWHPEDHNGYIFCEHHCAIRDVAQAFPQACATELMFVQTLFQDASVERIAHVVKGDSCCAYRIRPQIPTAGGSKEK